MSRRPSRVLAPLVVLAVLVGCSYHQGDATARDFDAWVKDHPLSGAEVTERSGKNVQPFQGEFTAFATLTAKPSESSIIKAIKSMCRFDDETSSSTTYWLDVDDISLQGPCDSATQKRVATFWTTVHELPGIQGLALGTRGVGMDADDDAITTLVPKVSAAADASERVRAKSTNQYASPHVTISQPRGKDLSDELALTQGVLDAAGKDTRAIVVSPGQIYAATDGTVEEARTWQRDVGDGSPVLTVTPAKVTTEIPLTEAGRDLLERLSTDKRVVSLEVSPRFWNLTTPDSEDGRGLVKDLDEEPGTRDLKQLVLYVGTTIYKIENGEGRSCFIRPVFPDTTGRAAALLDLCDIPSAVEVDDRFDAGLDLHLRGEDADHVNLREALACLKRMPYGLKVAVHMPLNDNLDFTTGKSLVPEYPGAESSNKLERLWASIPESHS